MVRFYQIARLKVGTSIFPDADALSIDLDGVGQDDLIENDIAFRAAIAPDSWFWLSGGGTLLLNGRYLPIVRRPLDARVNPGTFSLFTGRADDEAERADPALMVRELFEELLIYDDQTLLVPRWAPRQDVIDGAYAAIRAAGIIPEGAQRPLDITPVALPARPLVIRQGGAERRLTLSWTAGKANDINVLSLFAAECDLSRLSARDGEFHRLAEGGVRPAARAIYLLDTADGTARPLSGGDAICVPAREIMSPYLQFVLDAVC